MRAIKKKLKSQRGASLIIALLLFLVCAVIGSILIVSATSSAGRFSEMVRMDRRYYSVTSAAKLLMERYDEKKIRVICENGSVTEVSRQNDNSYLEIGSSEYGFLEKRSLEILSEEEKIKDKSGNFYTYNYSTDYPAFDLTVTGNGSPIADLNVKVEVKKVDNNEYRGVELTVYNNNSDKEQYRFKIACKADILKENRSADGSKVVYTVTWSTYDTAN